MLTDTIAGILTAPGRSAISVIRVSGQEAIGQVAPLFSRGQDLTQAPSHTIHYGWINNPHSGLALDEVLLLLMRGPRSYTGEDIVEIQCHGGSLAASEILGLLLRAGVRLAEPGEFTRRAFLNGKTDLTRAEAIMDMVDAQSDEALMVAARQKQGLLEREVDHMRDQLMELIAYIQADLDYPEDDIDRLSPEEYRQGVGKIGEKLESLLAGSRRGQLYREGLKVVLAGKPNVGKSSLLNALTGRQRAIVTQIPGTTRDIVRDHITIDGLPIEILDTAGLRDTDDVVEALGVDMTKEALQEADLVLYIQDISDPTRGEEDLILGQGLPVLPVYNKADLDHDDPANLLPGPVISAKTGQGLEGLAQAIYSKLLGEGGGGQRPLVSNRRHISLLEKTLDSLRQFQEGLALGLSSDLLVIDLQVAWEDLGRITGQTAEDDLLDEIFSRFCLGK